MLAKSKWKEAIQQEANRLGFSYFGVSKAEFLEDEANKLDRWLEKGKHGSMMYMENHYDKRLDPTVLVPGAKTVISLLFNYYTEKKQKDPQAPKISKYAYGKDYHYVIKDRLKTLVEFINREVGEISGRVFVDSAPVLERSWAKKSGIGWVGKNTNLITKENGSYFFLAEIISDIELEADGPIKDYCGTCTACIDACPTDAIQPYEVDGSKCISYLTIELKDEIIPTEFKGEMANWMFGCDICQEVCPWNRFSKPHRIQEFEPSEKLLNLNKNEWQELTEDVFAELFKKSPVKRTKYKGLKRNIEFLTERD